MKFTIFLILLFSNQFIIAQIINKSLVKQSDNYYCGEAVSENEKEASDAALAALIQNIAVTVSSDFQRNVQETSSDIKETVQSILKTYSTATLRNVKTIKSSANGQVDIFHYIEKSDVKKIFDERKKLIANIFDKANDFEKDSEFGYALKWYYFAIVLMNSIPEQVITYNNINLKTEIPYRITNIINSTKFYLKTDSLVSPDERELIFDIKTFDKPVQDIDFSFWDGSNQVNVQAIDGEATFTLFGSSTKFNKLDVNIKYSYYENRSEIKEVAELWNLVMKPSFDNSRRIILKKDNSINQITENILLKENANSKNIVSLIKNGNFKLTLNNNDSCKVVQTIGSQTLTLLELIKRNDLTGIKQFLSNDLFLEKRVLNLIKYNNISILDEHITADINKTYMGWELRKVKVLTYYPSLNKQTTEYLIFDFTNKGELYNVTFGIMNNLYEKFVKQGLSEMDWKRRQVIIKFVEKYRTAFMTRNISMLDSLFSDQAVIIIGRVFKKSRINDSYRFIRINNAQPAFEQIRLTKEEYLKRQKLIFNTQKDIYLGYSTFKITRKNKQRDVYGISMRQNYYSSSYSDEGYLFLLVDFNNVYPQIYIRSWQPQEWDDTSLIKLSNFNLNR